MSSRENVEIYDFFYTSILRASEKWVIRHKGTKYERMVKVNPELSDEEKTKAINTIFDTLSFEDKNAIRIRIHHRKFMNQAVWKGTDKKKILKQFETAWTRMYYPKNIAIAIPWFYDIPPYITDGKATMAINKDDFGGKKYIVTALNKSGIYYRCQLKKHLSLGWRYLWTIPGIGNYAKQIILTAIDHGLLNW